jgi:hypothetical protein
LEFITHFAWYSLFIRLKSRVAFAAFLFFSINCPDSVTDSKAKVKVDDLSGITRWKHSQLWKQLREGTLPHLCSPGRSPVPAPFAAMPKMWPQASHFVGLRTEEGCSLYVACGLQSSAAANRADPIWHVYPKGARREARWIFAGCGAAGRGILKDPKAKRDPSTALGMTGWK